MTTQKTDPPPNHRPQEQATPIPAAFLARMQALLGKAYPEFERACRETPTVGLRVNPLKVSPAHFRELSPFPLEAIPWCAEGFTVSAEFQPGKHPYHAAGLYYLQEPSAMAAVPLLDPQPGERVLDLAAAPGGKATQIAAHMVGQGLLVANEIHPQRVWELAQNLERWGAQGVAITNETPERLAAALPGFFDRVLVDAPCSGEGMFRKSQAARQDWSSGLVESCARRARLILAEAARMVRPGGRLVYATCTFAPEENEMAIHRFLGANPDFELALAEPMPGFSPGRPEWAGIEAPFPLERAVRIWPHQATGEGHFIAVLDRSGSPSREQEFSPQPFQPALPEAPLPKGIITALRSFWEAYLTTGFEPHGLALQGSYLYRLPRGLPDLGDLRVIHPGLWLGTVKPGARGEVRIEPSHALALSLNAEDARSTVYLEADDPHLGAYLRGETFECGGVPGWALVCVKGYPLGWGRRVGNTVKNHYPKGLRWLG